jgi:hypothetical protein
MPVSDSEFLKAHHATVRAFAIRLATGIVVANAIVILLVVLAVSRLRHEREERAAVTAQNLSRVLEHDLDNTLDKIDISLLAVADEVDRELRSGGLDSRAMNAFLAAQHSRVLETENLLMADAKGNILFGADLPSGPPVNVSERDFFAHHRDRPGSGLFISRPLFGRLIHRWLVVIARDLRRPDGTFLGVTWGVLSLDYFTRRFAALDIGPNGGISLRDAEMGIIARHPAPKDPGSIIGNKTLSPELRALFEAGRTDGTFFTASSWDNTPKVVSYRKIGKYPLFVNVGIATSDYLAGWKREAAGIVVLSALFVVGTLLLSWALFGRYRHEKLAELSLHALNAQLELRVAERTTELHTRNSELESALARVKHLEGIIPICMYCKKIRDDQDSWQRLEKYFAQHSEVTFSHAICPSCMEKLDPQAR